MSDEQKTGPTVTFKKSDVVHRRDPGVRWWPLVVGVSLAGGFLVFAWFQDVQRQNKVIATVVTGAALVLLFCLWCLFLSRLRWGIRLVSVGLVVVAGAVLASLLEFRSFNGDMIPQFEWRWKAARQKIQPQPLVVDTVVGATNTAIFLADYPQFLGPNRNVILDGPVLDRDWNSHPPRQLWRRPILAAWSGFAIVGTNAVTLEQDGDTEIVSCYNLMNGEPLWSHTYPARYNDPVGGVGPRTVPTIVSNRVYAIGATGVLNCLDLADGRAIWSKNVVESSNTAVPQWGITSSPLIVNGNVIVSVGGRDGKSLVAYDALSGEEVWSGGKSPTSYSAPVRMTLAGSDQVVMFNKDGVAGHLLSDGQVAWSYPWGNGQPHVAVPKAVGENRVFISAGYGVGSGLLEITRNDANEFAAQEVWRSIRLKAKFNNFAHIGNLIYGLDDGIMTCFDLEDGSRRWKEGRYGHGQLIVVGDLMLITAEKGEVILFEPVPEEPRELARFTAFDHKQWNLPALAGQLLVVRTDLEAACYLLPIVPMDADGDPGQPVARPEQEIENP